mmetsp:Transcript_100798/g.284269  ORF Transcript_100798/g.284269 Transcript_100798/m.284269 type:complete len:720 (-) Transcript_100798:208-2367(-)
MQCSQLMARMGSCIILGLAISCGTTSVDASVSQNDSCAFDEHAPTAMARDVRGGKDHLLLQLGGGLNSTLACDSSQIRRRRRDVEMCSCRRRSGSEDLPAGMACRGGAVVAAPAGARSCDPAQVQRRRRDVDMCSCRRRSAAEAGWTCQGNDVVATEPGQPASAPTPGTCSSARVSRRRRNDEMCSCRRRSSTHLGSLDLPPGWECSGCTVRPKVARTATLDTIPTSAHTATKASRSSESWWLRAAAMQTISPSCFRMRFSDLYEYLDKLDSNGAKVITLNAAYDHGSGYYMEPPSGERNLWCGLAMSDPWGLNSVFGSVEEFDRFVAVAHRRGMKVMSWLNPSYWWTGSPYFKQAEADIRQYGLQGLPDESPAHWFRWKEGCSWPYKPSDQRPGENGRGGMEQVWVCDPDVGLSYQSTWARQPLSNFGSKAFLKKWNSFLEYWIKERRLDGFVFDAPQAYNGIEQNGPLFRDLVTDPIRRLSNNSFLTLSEIYGDLHELVDFGLDGILPGGWDEQFRMWNRLVDGIRRGDMSRVDASFEYYDRLAENNVATGYPGLLWQRQHIDPFDCDQELNTITRAVSVAGGYFAAVEEARVDQNAWESNHWWEPDPYTGTPALNDLVHALEACEAFGHGTRRERLQVISRAGSQYALSRYVEGGAAGLAVFNFEGSEISVTVALPSRFAGRRALDCVTGTEASEPLSDTFEVHLPGHGFKLFGMN